MDIINVIDLPNGDCLIDFVVDDEEAKLLIEYAVLDLLKKAVEKGWKTDESGRD